MLYYRDVLEFHKKFGLVVGNRPIMPDERTVAFRGAFMIEEAVEFLKAHQKEDLPGMLDALIDIVYVAYGTAIMMGITPECWDEAWDEVQCANLKKERAQTVGQSKRGSTLDVVKPEGWTAPDIAAVLRRHGAVF
jgi:predicted HAD superfamily Cof-like phosphohydrolase